MPQLDYPYQKQQLSEWCWCAAGASIGAWYRKIDMPQCGVADLVFGKPCCASGVPSPQFNEPRPLDAPLRKLKNLAAVLDGGLAFDQLTAQIDQGRPVGVRVQWNDLPGVGHMVVLSGYDKTAHTVMVEDPKFGRQTCQYSSFRNWYLGHGFWSFTYMTRKQPDVG